MPLIDDIGLAPYVAPDRARKEAERSTLSDLLRPVAEKVTTSSASSGIPADMLAKLRQSLMASSMQSTLQSTLGAMTAGMTGSATPGAAPMATTVTPSIASIIGKRNYVTGRGDPSIRGMAQNVARFMGWGPDQFTAWDALINAESGWRPTAQNPTSTAYGLGQFLNGTWGPYGPKTSDPNLQLQYMARYIKNRYGDPIRALIEHNRKNWY